jgi:hypothetical protein
MDLSSHGHIVVPAPFLEVVGKNYFSIEIEITCLKIIILSERCHGEEYTLYYSIYIKF